MPPRVWKWGSKGAVIHWKRREEGVLSIEKTGVRHMHFYFEKKNGLYWQVGSLWGLKNMGLFPNTLAQYVSIPHLYHHLYPHLHPHLHWSMTMSSKKMFIMYQYMENSNQPAYLCILISLCDIWIQWNLYWGQIRPLLSCIDMRSDSKHCCLYMVQDTFLWSQMCNYSLRIMGTPLCFFSVFFVVW